MVVEALIRGRRLVEPVFHHTNFYMGAFFYTRALAKYLANDNQKHEQKEINYRFVCSDKTS